MPTEWSAGSPIRKQFQLAAALLGGANHRFVRILILAACVATAGGCQAYKLIHPDTQVIAAKVFVVQPGEPWNHTTPVSGDTHRMERWTRHGLTLDHLTFFGALREGEPLRRTAKRSSVQYTRFTSGMTLVDLVEMLEEYYRVNGAEYLRMADTVPVKLFGTDGMQIDFEYRVPEGLLRRGRAYAAIDAGRLYLVVFDAADLHYFGSALPEVDVMIRGAALR